MRSITKTTLKRLLAQRNEAKNIGLEKIASNLTEQLASTAIRADDQPYSYQYDELKKDIEASLWDSALRAQDFYGKIADARDISSIIESFANDFIDQIKVATGAEKGAYEEPLLGESNPAFDDIEVIGDE